MFNNTFPEAEQIAPCQRTIIGNYCDKTNKINKLKMKIKI